MSPADAITLLAPAFSRNIPSSPIVQALAFPGNNPSSPPAGAPAKWADLGCGSGVFTFALSSLLPSGSTIHAIDRRPGISGQLTANNVSIHPFKADFVEDSLPFRDIDGILMANSLHYVKDKPGLIRRLQRSNFRPQHELLIVEYDTDRPTSVWVPYPVSFASLRSLLQAAGYDRVTRLADRPSVFNRNMIYAAYCTRSSVT